MARLAMKWFRRSLWLTMGVLVLPTIAVVAASEPPVDDESAIETVAPIDLSGCWTGTWRSCDTGHKGKLLATFTRCGENRYRADFSGTFFVVLPFRYSVTFEAEQQGDTVLLHGDKWLGRRYGMFHFTAQADECHFRADYESCKDDGVFELCR